MRFSIERRDNSGDVFLLWRISVLWGLSRRFTNSAFLRLISVLLKRTLYYLQVTARKNNYLPTIQGGTLHTIYIGILFINLWNTLLISPHITDVQNKIHLHPPSRKKTMNIFNFCKCKMCTVYWVQWNKLIVQSN